MGVDTAHVLPVRCEARSGVELAVHLRAVADRLAALGDAPLTPTRLQVSLWPSERAAGARAACQTAIQLAAAVGLTVRREQMGSGDWFLDAGDPLGLVEVHAVAARATDVAIDDAVHGALARIS